MYSDLTKGLNMLFTITILSSLCSVLCIIPGISIIGGIGAIVCYVCEVISIRKISNDLDDAFPSFILIFVALGVSFLKTIGIFPTFNAILVNVALFFITYFICKATATEFGLVDEKKLEKFGNTVWKISLVVTVLTIVNTILQSLNPAINFKIIFPFILLGVSIVYTIFYVIYLKSAAKEFDRIELERLKAKADKGLYGE